MDLLSQMTTFVRVVDGKSLSAAARSLRLSLPAVSRQLSALEGDLGATLILRSTRRLQVTEAGRRYYEHCQRVLGEIDAFKNDLRTGRNAAIAGTLVVSASFTFGSICVAPLLPALLEKHPRLAIDLRLEDRLTDLVGEGIDVAIRAGPPPPDSANIIAHPLMQMVRVVVAAPRVLGRRAPKNPTELARLPALLQVTPNGAHVPWLLANEGVKGALPITAHVAGRLRASAPATLRDLAVAGAGLAYLPTWLVKDDLAAKRLVRVLPDWAAPPIRAHALYRTELRGAPRLHMLLEALTQV